VEDQHVEVKFSTLLASLSLVQTRYTILKYSFSFHLKKELKSPHLGGDWTHCCQGVVQSFRNERNRVETAEVRQGKIVEIRSAEGLTYCDVQKCCESLARPKNCCAGGTKRGQKLDSSFNVEIP
jgi:hypothetical protein